MEELTRQIIELLSSGPSTIGAVVLFITALIEYVFPPFPGDTVTLFGAFLAANGSWSVPLVFTAVTLGSASGSALNCFMRAVSVIKFDVNYSIFDRRPHSNNE